MIYNFSLILPCYNEEKNISILCMEFLQLSFKNIKAELILVNNGSNDNTLNEIRNEIKKNKSKIISSKINVKSIDLNNFKKISELNKQFNLQHLSIGMSGDYLKAIRFGASFVRIGSAIFGSRG